MGKAFVFSLLLAVAVGRAGRKPSRWGAWFFCFRVAGACLLMLVSIVGVVLVTLLAVSIANEHNGLSATVFNQDAALLFRNLSLGFFILPNAVNVVMHSVAVWRDELGRQEERSRELPRVRMLVFEALFESMPQIVVQSVFWCDGLLAAPAWGTSGFVFSLATSLVAFWWAVGHVLEYGVKHLFPCCPCYEHPELAYAVSESVPDVCGKAGKGLGAHAGRSAGSDEEGDEESAQCEPPALQKFEKFQVLGCAV